MDLYSEKLIVIEKMINRAMQETTSIRQLFDEESSDSPIGEYLDFATVEAQMQKARRRSRPVLPIDIGTFQEMVMDPRYSMSEGNQFFRGLVQDYDGESAAIFLHEALHATFQQTTTIHIDSTFKTLVSLLGKPNYMLL